MTESLMTFECYSVEITRLHRLEAAARALLDERDKSTNGFGVVTAKAEEAIEQLRRALTDPADWVVRDGAVIHVFKVPDALIASAYTEPEDDHPADSERRASHGDD